MGEGFKEYLKQEGVSNPEKPTKSDIKKILSLLPSSATTADNVLDETLIKEYYKYLTGALPTMMKTLNDLAAQSLGKDVVRSFEKRIDALNKRYETEKDPELIEKIREELSEVYDRIEKESDKQRDWLGKLAFGAMGTAVVLGGIAISIKHKEAGKKIMEEGIKAIQQR
ncbi:hypothetical protein AB5N96_12270 [Chryseomicrobium imtechense]